MRYLVTVALWIMMVTLPVSGAASDCPVPVKPTGILLSQVPGPAVSPPEPGLDSPEVLPGGPSARSGRTKGNAREPLHKSCPQTKYINCMPLVPEERRSMCSREYLQWVKEHCPGVKVVY